MKDGNLINNEALAELFNKYQYPKESLIDESMMVHYGETGQKTLLNDTQGLIEFIWQKPTLILIITLVIIFIFIMGYVIGAILNQKPNIADQMIEINNESACSSNEK